MRAPFERQHGESRRGDGRVAGVAIGGFDRRRARGQGGPSQRQLRVGESMRHVLAELLGRHEHLDPLLTAADITVAEVRVSPDLRHAVAFVIELGGGLRPELAAALDRVAPKLRGELARQLHLKHAPRLSFRADASFDEAARIEGLLTRERTILDRVGDTDAEDGHGEG